MKLTLFMIETCPYCIKARGYLNDILANSKYHDVEIEMIDETKQPELANQYDYFYVPAFFQGKTKLFEGIMTKEDVQQMLDKVVE